MIYYTVPYSVEKNIGNYYNDFMKTLPTNDDFGCFVDGDTIFTTSNYGHIIDDAIKRNPSISCFTCYTNRVKCTYQIAPGIDIESNDIDYHRKFGKSLYSIYGSRCKDVTIMENNQYMSGMFFIIKKSLWKKIGKFSENKMLGIDNEMHRRIIEAKERLFLIEGLYIYHWYRWPNIKDTSHLL
jgi:GT2 family glycosyltransferase